MLDARPASDVGRRIAAGGVRLAIRVAIDLASPSPSGTAAPSASPAPIDPPDVNLVVPEQLGSVVTLAPAARTGKGLNVGVTYPSAPGLYRLVMTLHDAAGVAYDAPTQSELRSVIVHVGGLYSAAFGAPSSLALGTGALVDGRRPRRQRRLGGLGRRDPDAAGRAGLAVDLAPHAANGRARGRDLGLAAGPARPGIRSRRRSIPRRRRPAARRRSGCRSWPRPRRATTCCCSTWSRRPTAPCPRRAAPRPSIRVAVTGPDDRAVGRRRPPRSASTAP